VGTDGEKNIDWIDTDNRLTVKNQWSLEEKKILKSMFRFYRKNNFFSNWWSILSVENEKFLTNGSIPSVASMTDSIGNDPSSTMPAKCYDGKKGQCQKICCSKTVKMKKAELYSSIKSCREYEDQRECVGIKWREIMCMISFNFIPTHSLDPRILWSLLLKNISLLSSF
jgi:hypothetical protein